MESNIGIARPNLSEITDRLTGRNNDVSQETNVRQLERTNTEQPSVEQVLSVDADTQQFRLNEQESVSVEEQERQLSEAIETVASFIEPQIRNVNFTQDDSTGQRVIQVFDAESDELIKQFPSDEILELAERIRGLQEEIVDKTGILIDDKV